MPRPQHNLRPRRGRGENLTWQNFGLLMQVDLLVAYMSVLVQSHWAHLGWFTLY